MDKGYVSLEQAARALGTSRRAVRNMLARGELEARTGSDGAATRPMVSAVSVERIMAHGRPAGTFAAAARDAEGSR